MQWCPAAAHFLASASQDGKLIIWNALTQNKVNAIPLRSSWIMSCAYSTTGSHVACGGLENVCYIYRLRDMSNVGDSNKPPHAELAGHDGYLSSCKFLSDNEILTASGDSTCILWDITRRTPIQKFVGHYGDVMSVSTFNRDVFASGSVDASVKLWDIRTNGANNSVKTFRGHESDVNSVVFFPDGNAVGTGSDDATCRIFDVRACAQVSKFMDNNSCGVTSIAFSHSGRLLFAGYDDENCLIWDSALGHRLASLQHENRVSSLAVNMDGKALCTSSWDSYLRVWL
eukprot:UN00474